MQIPSIPIIQFFLGLRAYSPIQGLQNISTHANVNHLLHFVDEVTGVHTQNIQSYCNRVKHQIKHERFTSQPSGLFPG